jgi:hypothetical protein
MKKRQLRLVGMPKNPIKRALEVRKIKQILSEMDNNLENAEEVNFNEHFAKIILCRNIETSTSLN